MQSFANVQTGCLTQPSSLEVHFFLHDHKLEINYLTLSINKNSSSGNQNWFFRLKPICNHFEFFDKKVLSVFQITNRKKNNFFLKNYIT